MTEDRLSEYAAPPEDAPRRLGVCPDHTGCDLYYERWWKARLRGITLRSWHELSASIRRGWDERALEDRPHLTATPDREDRHA